MDIVKAQKQVTELETKAQQIGAELNTAQAKANEKRLSLGAQVLDNPSDADKTQAELSKLEASVTRLQAAQDEIRVRLQNAQTDLQTARHESSAGRVRALNVELEKRAQAAFTALAGAQKTLADCAVMQSELSDLVRGQPNMPPASELIAVGFANLAEGLTVDLDSFARRLKAA